MNFPILSTLIFLPLISSFFIFLSKSQKNNNSAIYTALFSSVAAFILSIITNAKAEIKNFETVYTSSPSFLKIMKSLGAKFEIEKK